MKLKRKNLNGKCIICCMWRATVVLMSHYRNFPSERKNDLKWWKTFLLSSGFMFTNTYFILNEAQLGILFIIHNHHDKKWIETFIAIKRIKLMQNNTIARKRNEKSVSGWWWLMNQKQLLFQLFLPFLFSIPPYVQMIDNV